MYEDKTLTCKECGAEFVFTAGEQEFYAEKGLLMNHKDVKAAVMPVKTHPRQAEKCILQPVLPVVEKQKFLSSHVKTVQFIAANASLK